MSRPPDGMILALMDMDNHLIGLSCGLVCERELVHEDVRPLLEAVCAQHLAVKGNRPDMGHITWSDLRLALAGTLRICLAHLEGVEA